MTHNPLRSFVWVALGFLLVQSSPGIVAPAWAQTESDPEQIQEDRDLVIDQQHLGKIFDAVQAYKKKNGDLPNWLSDLYPEFLSDPNILMSPVELRTGRSAMWSYHDPKMRTSYVYEFSQDPSGTHDDNGRELTMKEKKLIQMEEYGPVIPLVRCHLYQRVLNLAYSGDIYRTALFWETDPNTHELMAKLGPGPGPRDARKMRLTLLDAATGQPIPDADVQTSKLIGMSLPVPPRILKTDAGGKCEINLVSKDQKALALRMGRDGYVTQQMEWIAGDIPDEWTAKLLKGVAIGGVVRDPAGKPISGVQVTLTTIQRNAAGEFGEMEAGVATTDSDGKWTSHRLSPDFKSVTLDLSRPGYRLMQYNSSVSDSVRPGEITKTDLLALQAAMVMKPAITVAGVVSDEAGRPIAGAEVLFQQLVEEPTNRFATTDAAGQFNFSLMTPGEGTLLAAAKDLSPQSNHVTFDDNVKPVAIKLGRGRALKGRVLDSDQKPVAGVLVALQSWAGAPFPKWSTATDEAGHFSWDFAPAEIATYSLSKDGYQATTQDLAPAPGELGDIVLSKVGLITGRVVDAQTKEPVPQFRLILGRSFGDDNVNWERNNQIQCINGRYVCQNAPNSGGEVHLLVEADGYLPAVSPALDPTGWVTNNFELKKGAGVTGVVKLPTGEPAANVQVALLNGDYTMLKDGQLSGLGPNSGRNNIFNTDAAGKFSLPPAYGTAVVATGPQGYSEAKLDEAAGELALTLQPWGRIEGTARNGRLPATNLSVMVNGTGNGGNMQLQYDFDSYRTRTDHQGRFVLTNVPPGRRFLVRLYEAGPGRWNWSHIEPVEVKSGEITRVEYGGNGRMIVGKVVPSEPGRIVDWNSGFHNFSSTAPKPPPAARSAADLRKWSSLPEVVKARAAQKYYAIQFEAGGSFHIDDVAPGQYNLRLQFNEPGQGNAYIGALIGAIQMNVEVSEAPTGRSDVPIDLGKVDVVVKGEVKLDTLAPDFEVKTLDGQPLKLSDFRGKYVLLDFWATWCGPCVAELPNLEATWKAFGANPNFAMISLSLDNDAETPRTFVQKRGYKWRQGFLGEWSKARLPDQYGVQGIPSLFLIGPDGKFVSKDMRGSAIREAVEKALAAR